MGQSLVEFLSRSEVVAGALSIVAWLVLTWMIRGVPIGQAAPGDGPSAPSSGYRDRVVLAAVVGFLLVLLGALIAVNQGVPWSIPVFLAGFGLILTVQRINDRHRHSSPTLRRVAAFSNVAMNTSLLAGVLVVANAILFRVGGRPIDLTHDASYSISSQTTNILRGLEKPVRFVVFHGRSASSRQQLDRVRQLLSLYQRSRPDRIRIEYVNQFEALTEFQELAKRVPDVAAANGDGLVIEYGEDGEARRATITNPELFEVPRDGASATGRYASSFQGENVLTSTLVRLIEGKSIQVGFTQGHGEPALDELGADREGLGLWRSRLVSVGVSPTAVDLVRASVPNEVQLLAIVGPKNAFLPDEVRRLREFVQRGGRLIVLLDGTARAGLEDFLRTFNIEFGPGIVIDPAFNFNRVPEFCFAGIGRNETHPVIASLAGQSILVPTASPIRILGAGQNAGASSTSNPGIEVRPILQTSVQSWAETDLTTRPPRRDPGKDLFGPVTVGVAASEKALDGKSPADPKLVLISSRFLPQNSILQNWPPNLDLLLNSMYWLRGKPERLGIAPKTHVSPLFVADPGLKRRLVLVPTTLAITLIIGLGVTVYLSRRE